jgi:RNA polymerase-binding protein DksA
MLDPDSLAALRRTLEERRRLLTRRAERIQTDVRHQDAPLEADSEEQATQLENDPVLAALDGRGREQLAAIDAALARIAAGSYGSCAACGDEIAAARLRAVPTASTCAACAA